MGGGPINGGAGIAGIIVPTALQITADALNYWMNLTCLYDRYWSAEADRVTLPICMFHIKKITPTYSNDVSKKRVILFEPESDEKLSPRPRFSLEIKQS